MVKTLTIEELAARIGKSPRTVRTDMVRRPDSIPVWFKLPGARKALWLESTVDSFILEQAGHADALPKQGVKR
jgi:hypothetical protein